MYLSSFSNGMNTCGTKVLLLEESLEYSISFEMLIFILVEESFIAIGKFRI